MESLIDLESAINRLNSSSDSLSCWLGFWTALVVIGLVIEYAHDVWKFLFEKPRDLSLLRQVIGGILITAGVAGELAIGMRQSSVETQLRDANSKIAAFLNEKAGEAYERAAQANGKAEGERLERLKLEASVAPRNLST
jgi:hypothetical protein